VLRVFVGPIEMQQVNGHKVTISSSGTRRREQNRSSCATPTSPREDAQNTERSDPLSPRG